MRAQDNLNKCNWESYNPKYIKLINEISTRSAAAVGNVGTQPIEQRVPGALRLRIQAVQLAHLVQPVADDVALGARHHAQSTQRLEAVELQVRICFGGHAAAHVAGEHGELAATPEGTLAVQSVEQGQDNVLIVLDVLEVQLLGLLDVHILEHIVDQLDAVRLIEQTLALRAAQQQGKGLAVHVPKVCQAIPNARVQELKQSQLNALLGSHLQHVAEMMPQVWRIQRLARIQLKDICH